MGNRTVPETTLRFVVQIWGELAPRVHIRRLRLPAECTPDRGKKLEPRSTPFDKLRPGSGTRMNFCPVQFCFRVEAVLIRALRVLVATCALAVLCLAQTPEEKTAKYMESVRKQPELLLAFLQEMPKGGDLHIHLSGAIYAESLIDWASENALCVERSSSKLIHAACDSCELYQPKPSVRCAYQDHVLYNQLIDAWSMRNWDHNEESGHDHFFASFDKFGPATDKHTGEAFAEVAARAAEDHLQYVEVMHTADGREAANLGSKIGWDDDFVRFREKLLAGGMSEVVAGVRTQTDEDEAREKEVLHCGTARAEAGCAVTMRYLYQVLRGLPREQVFAQIVLGFELAKADPRFVGFNLVMPEDWYVPMHDFDLHMRMIEALRKVYPGVHISLHADELAMGLVPPEGLRFHIRESVERAGAERIGHGVAVMNEDHPIELLKEMAAKEVLVEICLTSNDVILGVSGDRHPLPIYLKYGVPVALATDDEGVSRTDITHEYLRAALDYGLTYADLKRMARASLEHSFMEVKERVRVQQKMEEAFAEFEKKY